MALCNSYRERKNVVLAVFLRALRARHNTSGYSFQLKSTLNDLKNVPEKVGGATIFLCTSVDARKLACSRITFTACSNSVMLSNPLTS